MVGSINLTQDKKKKRFSEKFFGSLEKKVKKQKELEEALLESGTHEMLQKSLSHGSEWNDEDLDLFEMHFREEKAASSPADAGPADAPSLADDASDEAGFDPSTEWHWMLIGAGAPLEPIPANAALCASLQRLSSFYRLFPDQVRLGASRHSNEIRGLHARRLFNTVRALRRPVVSGAQLKRLPGVSHEWAEKINVLMARGELEVQTRMREAATAVALFKTVLYTGRQRAWKYYEQGARTLDDLRARDDLEPRQILGLQHYEDLNSPLPRWEVEAFEKKTREMLLAIDPRLQLEIGGSYARGQDPCCDADFLIYHPDAMYEECSQALDKLVAMLSSRGILQHVLNLENSYAPRFGKGQSRNDLWWQARPDHRMYSFRLIMCLARVGKTAPMRRVDFFVCSYKSLAPMRLYVTGNLWFNRKLRQYAEEHGYILCNSAFGKKEGSQVVPVPVESDKDIFRELGLEYVEPKMREY